MISKVVTDYLRDLAYRLETIVDSGLAETSDIRQLIDLADTLDADRLEDEAADAELKEMVAQIEERNRKEARERK
jgi:hypothetical protein